MAIEKFLAMENGEPDYTKLGTVTHVPFPAGGNGVQMVSARYDQQWTMSNTCIIPVTPSNSGYIEFTSRTHWAVGIMGANNSAQCGVTFNYNAKILTFSRSNNVGGESGSVSVVTDISSSIHRWGVSYSLGSSGSMQVFCDGVLALDFNGSTQGDGAVTHTTGLRLSGINIEYSVADFDSVVISTDSFQGDCHVDYLVPDGNGDTSQWVGSDSDSVDNWELVDEIPASGADYVEADEVDLRDLYTVANLPASGTILGVQAVVHPWKLGPGAEIPTSTILKTGVGEHVDLIAGMSTAMQSLSTTIRTTRPGGGAWTVADVNNLQIGVTTEEP